MLVTSEQVLAGAKRDEAQRAQAAVINSMNVVKDFDEICARKSEQNGMKLHAAVKMPMGEIQILWFKPPIQVLPGIWEEICHM